MAKTFFVTGGAGFIGSAVVRYLIQQTDCNVVNLDRLTYAGNLETLACIDGDSRYRFVQGDIADRVLVKELIEQTRPAAIVNLAAETHVDRSIDNPADFIHSNIIGTATLLEAAREYWNRLGEKNQAQFRFLHVSTDEVFGSLAEGDFFCETTPYDPSSPYSATKASSDHLVRAWHRTYGLPVLVTNCSNNYGPYQFPEKLIPLMVLKALADEELPVYGRGDQVRDWIYVEDHVNALMKVLESGNPGETYNLGSCSERTNLELIENICEILVELDPVGTSKESLSSLITFVEDRPGHDQRYAIDNSKVVRELKWKPQETFESGLRKTVQWICENRNYYDRIKANRYAGQRLGMGQPGQG